MRSALEPPPVIPFHSLTWRAMRTLPICLLMILITLSSGCAHADLRRSLKMSPLETTTVQHLQARANAAFPLGTPYATVRQHLAPNSGPVPPLLMFFTFRPWPFEPWAVWDEQGTLHAQSEEERSWIFCWERNFIYITFEFDTAKHLRSIKVDRSASAL